MGETNGARRRPGHWSMAALLAALLIASSTGAAPAAATENPVLADEPDLEGPTGTVVIDGGAEFMGDPWDWDGPAYTFPSVTLSVTVEDAGPDLPPQAWAVSRDGVTWQTFPLYAYGAFELEYELIQMDVDEGTKTVWAKAQDAAGNWSAPFTDTIELRYQRAGRVVVGTGSGYEDSFVVDVRFPVDVMPPEGVATVWVSSDYLGCANQPYGNACNAREEPWSEDMVLRWDLRDPDYYGSDREGHRRVVAWVVSTTGRVARLEWQGFVLDRLDPVTGDPRPMITPDSVVGDATPGAPVTASIRWSAGGTGSPVAQTQLQQSTDDAAWVSVSLTTPTAKSARRTLVRSTDYRFRSRSQDTAGNWSQWSAGAEFRVVPVQETSTKVNLSAGWRTQRRDDAFGGSLVRGRGDNARATFTFTGRGVAVVAPRSPSGAEFDVYLDGRFIKHAFLHATTYEPRRIVYTTSWAKSGTHTIRIVKRWPNEDYPISIDAFLVLK